MSIRETFSNSIDLAVISKYEKCAVIEISTVLRYLYQVASEVSSETGLFTDLSDYVFRVLDFENTKSMWVFFFRNF